jgi:hypothetical protein
MPSPDWTRGPKGWEEAANLCRSRTREKSPPQRKTERIRVSTERKLPDTALEVITTRGATPNRVAKPKARETVGKKTVWWPKLWLPDGKAGRKGGPKGGHKGGKKGGQPVVHHPWSDEKGPKKGRKEAMDDRWREDDDQPWHTRPTQREQHGRASSSSGRRNSKKGGEGFDRESGHWDGGKYGGGNWDGEQYGRDSSSSGRWVRKDGDKGFDRGKSGDKGAGKGFDRGKSGDGWGRGTSSDRKGRRPWSPGYKRGGGSVPMSSGGTGAPAMSPGGNDTRDGAPPMPRYLTATQRTKTAKTAGRASAASVSPPRTVADSPSGDEVEDYSYYSRTYSSSEDCVLDMTACL